MELGMVRGLGENRDSVFQQFLFRVPVVGLFLS